MKIKTYGARFYADQISRIDKGFLDLGHELVSESEFADVIYNNDFEQIYTTIVEHISYKVKYIQNVLDLPFHCWKSSDFKQCKERLLQASAVTTISETVKEQILKEFGITAHCIYQPIKPITNLNLKKSIEFAFIGRNLDPNKRTRLGIEVINKFRETIPNIRAVSVGGEDMRVDGIEHLGILNDEELNEVYNKTKYVFCLGSVEGLCLPIPESICGSSIPICLGDNPTAFEFCPHAFIAKPEVDEIYKKIQKLDFYYEDLVEGICKPLSIIYQQQFSPKQVAQNIIDSLS
jgi:glycosyltransferase involved in cell wall biosynthesis